MANAFGIDFGAIARNAESIKTMKMEREERQRQIAKDKESDAELTGLRERAVGGDKAALPAMVAMDPKAAGEFMGVFEALDPDGQKAKQREIELVGKAAAFVLQSPDPAKAYQTVLAQMPPETRERFPPDYDETFVQAQLAQATEADAMIDNYWASSADKTKRQEDEAADIRKTERQTQKEITVAKATAAIKAGAAGGKRQPKAADSSLFQKGALRFFDGIIGPDGQVTLTDPKNAAKAQQLMTKASTIWSRTEMTHDEAMEAAADELGYGLAGGGNAAADNDPLGLRGG